MMLPGGAAGLDCLNVSPIPYNTETSAAAAAMNSGSPMLDLGTFNFGGQQHMGRPYRGQKTHRYTTKFVANQGRGFPYQQVVKKQYKRATMISESNQIKDFKQG